jgi:hypothetical protein
LDGKLLLTSIVTLTWANSTGIEVKPAQIQSEEETDLVRNEEEVALVRDEVIHIQAEEAARV